MHGRPPLLCPHPQPLTLSHPCRREATAPADFTLIDGTALKAPMMQQRFDQGRAMYTVLDAEVDGAPIECPAIRLAYNGVNRFSSVVTMPAGNLTADLLGGQLGLESDAGPLPYADALAACRRAVSGGGRAVLACLGERSLHAQTRPPNPPNSRTLPTAPPPPPPPAPAPARSPRRWAPTGRGPPARRPSTCTCPASRSSSPPPWWTRSRRSTSPPPLAPAT